MNRHEATACVIAVVALLCIALMSAARPRTTPESCTNCVECCECCQCGKECVCE